jgi:predicted Zn finger-like uncharacterized protein
MPIVCPHCTTSYNVDPATFGPAGRTVRCARCKEVWLARPQDAFAMAAAPHVAPPETDWEGAPVHAEPEHPPEIDSPSIAGGWPEETAEAVADHGTLIEGHAIAPEPVLTERRVSQRRRRSGFQPALPRGVLGLPTACAAMASLVLALMIWRTDVVRLLPQTANFYKSVGLGVNLRGLSFKDVKLSTASVEGKQVVVVEGVIVGESRKPVELPRLRFVVRDAKGSEIYAWNAVLEQAVLQPGDKAWFKSRLASPPADGHSIDIRFFNKRDLAAGAA